MDYTGTVDFIYGLQKHGVKLGLDRIRHLLGLIGNPQHSYPSIHIAGTNGKGSVSAITASIVAEAGFKTGLFTSPHLLSFTERIRINGINITEEDVVEYGFRIRSVIDNNRIESTTFFEFVTALSMLYFADKAIGCAVFETGMGGRLDATNILRPDVTVITKIGYDHKEFLGETLSQIASEKAGIIKVQTPVVCSSQRPEALETIRRTAQERDAEVYLYGEDFSARLLSSSPRGLIFDFLSEELSLNNLSLPLAGDYQMENGSTAIMASYLFLRQRLPKDELKNAINRGISKVLWEGRLQMLSLYPQILIDGAHNPEAAESLASFITNHLPGQKIILVIAIMSDKDAAGILKPLLPLSERTFFTAPQYDRAATPKRLYDIALSMGFKDTETTGTVREALQRAFSLAGHSLSDYQTGQNCTGEIDAQRPLIIITGSFYLLGDALEILGPKAILGNLRETMKGQDK